MKHSKHRSLLFIVFILVLLSGCNKTIINNLSEEKLKEEISYWSSEKFQGRQTGTKGNNLARDEIAKQFKQLELVPVKKKDYLMPFEMYFFNPVKIQSHLVVNLQDGQKKDFSYGTDWMEKYTDFDVNLELPISFSESKGKILITDELQDESENVAIQFVRTETFRKTSMHAVLGGSVFQITDSFYTYLKSNEEKIKNIELNYSGPFEQITAHNVVGKISSSRSNKKQAIVISAHFDHMGTAGDTTFLGSVDNATGITALMNLASILKDDSKKQAFASDIIFVAFNAEESGLVGSTEFVEEISSQYQSILNINLDCIGVKDGGEITFFGEEPASNLLSEKLTAIAKEMNITSNEHIEKVATSYSDHVPFMRSNYQAITISQERFDKIHTPEDNIEYTDSKPLKDAIEIVQNFVLENHNIKFEKINR
ncbi:M28 family metallopeptidase [Psychrobacillus vulpis]|uniref:Zn-dependent exopeptidase M28 n=1 Tax=Psychrobacillus vulpis TaxID=2325572 RepID=A0A544TNJ9_9BACI|nr:M28 family metallopeptidase [Psychrobacillus vulpis]TQR19026.1 Zn-dependent exopeptidase M28 [Psychrobacillus vulpis]